VVVNSFSKYWSMTGWRVGWLLLPPDLLRPVECLAQNLFISAPHVAQVAAEAAMDCGRSWKRTAPATAATATCCCANCRARASTASRRRTARSISGPTSAT
jgi:aspartate/methionine/tyrosine aminotransferase